MIPVLTPDEMREVDRAATEPVEVLIARAGAAVARAALTMMGGGYGKRAVVVAGKGNNGADGRRAARRLARAGVRVAVVEAGDAPPSLPACHLVIDAAYGTGFRGEYAAPAPPPGVPVLAVDIPSGVDGLTGEAGEGAVRADATVTFAALKPGLLLGAGRERAGLVDVADIGLDAGAATMHLVEDGDVRVPPRPRDAHKWQSAVFVAAGSPGMTGAALLAGRSALRGGSGNVRIGVPGADVALLPLAEMVGIPLPRDGWADGVIEASSRCLAMVIGPGLGRDPAAAAEVRRVLDRADLPAVVDADALSAVDDGPVPGRRVRVLTPHDGEFARMCGSRPGADRVAAARGLARRTGAVVLLKGPTTVVAAPDGAVRLTTSGRPQLATAGSGDVLSGLIGAFLARGLDGPDAAAFAAHAHGAAAALGPCEGLVAGDVADTYLPRWLSAHAAG